MYKLVLLFTTPPDPVTFETRWANEFVPLAEKLPGVQHVVVTRFIGSPSGTTEYHLIHELHFATREALVAAMSAPDGLAAGKLLTQIAAKHVHILFAEHQEDIPRLLKS